MPNLRNTTIQAPDRALGTYPETSFATDLPPPLKWAGGKRWLLPRIRALWNTHRSRRLVEPFCGGLAITLGLAPDRALLNDINPHLINFYKWVQRGLVIDLPLRNNRLLYNRHRRRFNDLIATGSINTKEAAALFYYMNRTGYNGLCRFNRKGEFNVPFGTHRTILYKRDFADYSRLLAPYEFHAVDFEQLALKADDFIYADPPYDVTFTQYSKDGFAWDDQVRTAEWLARHPGPVAISNQATSRVVRLYKSLGFALSFLHAPRMISCNGDRGGAREVLAVKNI